MPPGVLAEQHAHCRSALRGARPLNSPVLRSTHGPPAPAWQFLGLLGLLAVAMAGSAGHEDSAPFGDECRSLARSEGPGAEAEAYRLLADRPVSAWADCDDSGGYAAVETGVTHEESIKIVRRMRSLGSCRGSREHRVPRAPLVQGVRSDLAVYASRRRAHARRGASPGRCGRVRHGGGSLTRPRLPLGACVRAVMQIPVAVANTRD